MPSKTRSTLCSAIGMDTFALQNLDPDLLGLENDLYLTKWFDYRGLHPVAATVLFSKAYYRIVAEYVERQVCHTTASFIRKHGAQFSLLDANKQTITGFWRARQQADRLGVKYEIFIRSIVRTLRDWGWKRIPRPNQFYSAESLQIAGEGWLSEMEGSVMWPVSVHCNAGSDAWFKPLFDQFFVTEAMKRPAWRYILKDAISKAVMTKEEVTRALQSTKGGEVHGFDPAI
jgi:hypothetical protein